MVNQPRSLGLELRGREFRIEFRVKKIVSNSIFQISKRKQNKFSKQK